MLRTRFSPEKIVAVLNMNFSKMKHDTLFRFCAIVVLCILGAVIPASALPLTSGSPGLFPGTPVAPGTQGLNVTMFRTTFADPGEIQTAGTSVVPLIPGQEPTAFLDPARETGDSGMSAGTACNGKMLNGGTARYISKEEEEEKIRKVREYIKKLNLSWTAGKTSVSNLSPAAYTALRGLKHPAAGSSFRVTGLDTTAAVLPRQALPVSFDWRNYGGDFTTPVRNQGGCGSCWAFASTATFESFWERNWNKPDKNPNFAEQYLVSCNTDGMNCADGGFSSALAFFVNEPGISGGVGTVTEGVYPYTARDTSCKSLADRTRYKVPAGGSWNYLAGDCVISPVEEAKQAIYTYGPLNAYVDATDNFMFYESGIFEDPTWSDRGACGTNHVIQLVGWGHDPVKDKDYWIAKNSWGTGWGEDGFFKIYADQCRIGEGVAYLTARPRISRISPATGSTAGNRLITITGTGFNSATTVRFGTTPGTSMTVVSDTKITISSPAHAAGVADVRVTTPGGTSGIVAADKFTFGPPPVITGITPTSGPTEGNTLVTITGTGFTGATSVRFGPMPGTSVNIVSDTQITARSPAHSAGGVNIRVTTPYGMSGLVPEGRFTYA